MRHPLYRSIQNRCLFSGYVEVWGMPSAYLAAISGSLGHFWNKDILVRNPEHYDFRTLKIFCI